MAQYKVIQDIEAEDKLLGPLTLRQFIYASIVVVLGFISFKLLFVKWFLIIPFLPPIVFFGLLAAPFGHDQPNEVWLLAKIRFFLKPRRRIWDQSGIKDLVTITVPKFVEKHLTNGLSQNEVRSRLQALANTIDSRGWAIKNINVNMYSQPSYILTLPNSDRLIDPTYFTSTQPVEDFVVADVLDEQTSSTAHIFDQMLTASTNAHRQQIISQLQGPVTSKSTSYAQSSGWFADQTQQQTVSLPGANVGEPTVEEQILAAKFHDELDRPNPAYGHMRVLQPLDPKHAVVQQIDKPMTPPPDPVILGLAQNDDLSVASIARQAAENARKQPPNDEVVISLR